MEAGHRTLRIVAATYGGKGSERMAGTAIGGLTTIATDVLQHARHIPLLPTTTDEVAPLRGRLPDTDFETVAATVTHGLLICDTADMFPVEIWGTVAQWISAVGTSGAAIAAGSYYILDKRRAKKTQSKKIYISYLERKITDQHHVHVTNNSDNSIFDVHIYILPRAYGKLAKDRAKCESERQDIKEKLQLLMSYRDWQRDWQRVPEIPKVGPGESATLKTDCNLIYEHISLIFRDAATRRWIVDIDPSHRPHSATFHDHEIKRLTWRYPASEYWPLPRYRAKWITWRNRPYHVRAIPYLTNSFVPEFVAKVRKHRDLGIDISRIEIRRGKPFERVFNWTNEREGCLDISGYRPTMKIKTSEDDTQVVLDATHYLSCDATAGKVTLALPGDVTAGLDIDSAYFELELLGKPLIQTWIGVVEVEG